MSATHTPGPWSYWSDVAYQHGVVTRDSTAGHIAVPSNCGESTTANARLIAAAPELLAALEMALESLESVGLPQEWNCLPVVTAAIAKARGEV